MKRDFAIYTKSADETVSFGKEFASKLSGGSIVSLYGDLGSGKTQVVKGICLGLGVTQRVNSPTFIIVNEYSSGRFPKIFHFDLYRMKTREEILEMGFNDYIDKESIVLIEWPERVEDMLPKGTIKIHISHTVEEKNSRWIKLETPE